MLKGLKKKIKGKKGHKEDLFDQLENNPELLEKYRLDIEAKKAAAAAGQHEGEDTNQDSSTSSQHQAGNSSNSGQADEEWKKFAALTSGVDSILNKYSDELDRIKKDSVFKNAKANSSFLVPTHGVRPNVTTVSKVKGEDLVKGHQEEEEEDHHQVSEVQKPQGWVDLKDEDETDWGGSQKTPQPNQDLEEAEPQAESPDVEAIQVDDDLFDTSFVDAVATGDIKLAYVPDSPTEEEEDDPFDTSAISHVVKDIEEEHKRRKRIQEEEERKRKRIQEEEERRRKRLQEEEERKRKRQLSLGVAVSVLAGQPAEAAAAGQGGLSATDSIKKSSRRPRPHRINLLGLDEGDKLDVPDEIVLAEDKGDSVLDQILGSPAEGPEPVDFLPSVSPLPAAVSPAPPSKAEEEHDSLQDLLNEFDVIDRSAPVVPSTGFNLAAALGEEDDLEDEFAALAAESVHKDAPKTPTPATPPEDDPFDTGFAEAAVKVEDPLPAADGDDDFDFDPRAGEEPRSFGGLATLQKDLLGGSATELDVEVIVGASSLEPEKGRSAAETTDFVDDPFDTSVVTKLLPGKAELRLLEEELLKEEEIKRAVQAVAIPDDDFDPRAGEAPATPVKPARPPPPPPKANPLDIVETSSVTQHKALTPQLESEPAEEIEIDPFDTSIASDIILPGKQELKLLESELSSAPAIPSVAVAAAASSLDFDDFDPRAGEPPVKPTSVPISAPRARDIFDTTPCDLPAENPLLPTSNASEEIADPFDTSALEANNFLPGKAELKFLEKELLENTEPYQPKPLPYIPVVQASTVPAPPPVPEPVPELHPLETEEFDLHTDFADEPLKPHSASDAAANFADPFDTTIANTIVPGKIELKILEEELSAAPQLPTFQEVKQPTQQPLVPQSAQSASVAVPTPVQQTSAAAALDEDIDPFDTSAAETIQPGKAELKILEAELL